MFFCEMNLKFVVCFGILFEFFFMVVVLDYNLGFNGLVKKYREEGGEGVGWSI